MTDFPRQYATSRRYTLGAPRDFTISTDGTRVLFLRSEGPDDPVLCLWSLDVASGREDLLVDPKRIGGDGDVPAAELARRERARESAGGIVAYSTDEAGTKAAFTLGGDLYVVDVVNGHLTALPTVGSVFDPVIDPSGRRVAYAGDGDESGLWTVATTGREPATLVVGDQDPLVSWGRAEFIAAEEMSRTRGFWWSPDGAHVLVQRVSEHTVGVWWIGDPAHPDRKPRAIRYPAAGTANARVDLVLFSLDGPSAPVDIDWSAQGSFEYLANVIWAAGHNPLIVRQTRDQRRVEIVELTTPHQSHPTPVVRRVIENPVWVELLPTSPRWAGGSLLTIEDGPTDDNTGARRLHRDGVAITGEDLQVRAIVTTEPDLVEFTASPADDATVVHLYRLALTDSDQAPGAPGTPTPLTTEAGVHHHHRRGGTTVSLRAVPNEPGRRITVQGEATGEREPATVHTVADFSATPVITAAPRFLVLGPRRLNAALFVPTDHDGVTPLPVLLDPYGGPHAQRVLQAHDGHLVSQWFADQGYAVLVIDGRGTPGRGPAFEHAVWGDLAGPVLDDQIDGLDAAAETLGFLDLNRVAIRGWSFGGYLAALAVLRRGDRVHAAVAGAPVTDWRLYDTHYTERYLGHPDQDAAHYERTDLTAEAATLARPLLLIHGLADDNVVAAHSLRLSTALLGAGRAHQVLPLSGVTHMTPQESVAENLLLLQRDFLVRHVPPGATPTEGAPSAAES